MKKIKKLYASLSKISYWVILTFLILIAGLASFSILKIPGNFKILVVQSGSMEPQIKKMGVVIVKPFESYKIGDVITVKDPDNPKISVTHRVVKTELKNNKISYITKGDANEDPDSEKRLPENILGKVIFTIPFLGIPLSFVKTQLGLILMIIIPSAIIVYSELISIKNEVLRLIKERRKRKLTLKETVEKKIGEEIVGVEKGVQNISKVIRKDMRKFSHLKNDKN